MKNKIPKLHLIASTDKLRPSMNGVFIDGQHAVAADGHALLAVDWQLLGLEIDGLDGCIIPSEAWKIFSDAKNTRATLTRDGDTVKVSTAGKSGAVSVAAFPLIRETFPNYVGLIRGWFDCADNGGHRGTIAPALLGRIHEAMPGDVRHVDFQVSSHPARAILATLRADGERVGVALIMPCIPPADGISPETSFREFLATKETAKAGAA